MYKGCNPKHTCLELLLNLMDLKAQYKCNDVYFDKQLEYLQEVLPEGNTLPTSIDEAKKILCPLDLPVEKYHECHYDCIVYRKEYANLEECPVCGTSRYKFGRKAPHKVVWYFPFTPRVQRYFADPKEAKLMRWHKERSNADDEVLRHPADANQWKVVDLAFPDFVSDPRNLRLGMSTDEINPFCN